MSLNVFVGEVKAQTESMVAFYRETIAAMEDVMRVVNEFAFEQELQGKTYDSAKGYFVATYRPLAQGMICLCEELIRQNEAIPRDFQGEVATVDVIEDQVRNQIRQLDGQIQDMEKLSNNVVGMALITPIFVDLRQKLQEKLEALYRFDAETATSFERATDLAANVVRGLAEIGKDKGFQVGTGTFSLMGMNMTWSSVLQEQWAAREKAIAQGLKDAETARMIKLAEDGPLPVVPEGNLAGFVTKDGKLDGKATYDNAKWQQAHYLAGMENAIFLIDMVTPVFDAYRWKTGFDPITQNKLQGSEQTIAAGFTLLSIVPFGKVGKVIKSTELSSVVLKNGLTVPKNIKLTSNELSIAKKNVKNYAETGGRDLDFEEYLRNLDKVDARYDSIRANKADVSIIAKNTEWSEWKVQKIKDHVFLKEHKKDSGIGRFDSDIEIADAWGRLEKGTYTKNDMNLLEHELFESKFEGIFKTDYRTAHDKTIKSGRIWDPFKE
ncbi:T7SS effector LXG polymorphic toxin [Listeria rustica]|uniref:LXG domain-containing protein n=1 Tax=Listeria rustica TaxID=2713503 RepID=A0A7W1YFK8_9LIST|nr:hypothetical protein [Listeria rustica]